MPRIFLHKNHYDGEEKELIYTGAWPDYDRDNFPLVVTYDAEVYLFKELIPKAINSFGPWDTYVYESVIIPEVEEIFEQFPATPAKAKKVLRSNQCLSVDHSTDSPSSQ